LWALRVGTASDFKFG
jgi:hypothetical protein